MKKRNRKKKYSVIFGMLELLTGIGFTLISLVSKFWLFGVLGFFMVVVSAIVKGLTIGKLVASKKLLDEYFEREKRYVKVYEIDTEAL